MQTSGTEYRRFSRAVAVGLLVAGPMAAPVAAFDSITAGTQPVAMLASVQPNPLLSIDQNRTTVVDRVVAQWGDALAASGAGLTKGQLQALLTGLRSDQLLAANLAGSLDGLRNVIANALTATAPVAKGLIQTKALGDTADDLVYTPVTPCREVDTRNAGGQITGGSARDFKVWVSSGGFTAQGGSPTNCNIPANPVAVVVNLTAVSPAGAGNFIAYPTGTPTSTSALNYQSGEGALGNGAIVPVCQPSCANHLTIATNGAGADLVVDIVGYFKPPNGSNIVLGGNITLVESTSPSVGNIQKGSTPFIHNYGFGNTFVGENAGNFTMISNIAPVPPNPVTGAYNTAIGVNALYGNTTGAYNTATGLYALESNTTGSFNTALGQGALQLNTGGGHNTAVGEAALLTNTAGIYNIALGYAAGSVTTSDYNILIGNNGVLNECCSIRIGDDRYNVGGTYIAGIRGSFAFAGAAVYVDSSGRLGTSVSSRRYKDDIAPMDEASAALMKLRPVTFHYKSDQNPAGRALQYGLIAEEVVEVYPGLVAHSADGKIDTVMYQFLAPMLLNEYQKQQRVIEAQAARIDALEKQAAEIAMLKQQIAQMAQRQEQAARLALATGK